MIAVIFISALVCTLALLLCLIPLARRFELIANPGEHRQHQLPTPLIGGIAIFLSLILVSPLFSIQIPGLLLCALALVLVFGVIDDMWTVPFWFRFIVQIGAAIILVYDGVILRDLGHLFSDQVFTLGKYQYALTVFSIVGVINAINMIDGMDGLCGLVVLVALIAITSLLPIETNLNEVLICVILIASVVGFLLLNIRFSSTKSAKVFLGDAGSMLLGLILSWLVISKSQHPNAYFSPVVALWILAIPLIDTVGVMIRRICRGISPFHADHLHTHHLFLNLGFSVNRSLLILIFLAIGFATFGIAAFQNRVDENILFFIFLGLFVVYIVAMELGLYYTNKIDVN